MSQSPEDQAQTAPEPTAGETPQQPDYYQQILRLKAEFENYRKRVDRERPELYKLGRAELLLRLLPVYDLLQRVHEQIQSEHAKSQLAKGMEGVFKEFEKIFKEEGISPMNPAGKPYDPLRHEVLGTVAAENVAEGTVVEVLQNGFLMQDKVLRAAKVRIAKKEAAS